jgi:hypothetical protein
MVLAMKAGMSVLIVLLLNIVLSRAEQLEKAQTLRVEVSLVTVGVRVTDVRGLRSLSAPAAVDGDVRARDERRLRRTQIDGEPADLLGASPASDRYSREEELRQLGIVQ